MIVGHKKIIQFLQYATAHDKLSHAYLFYGPQHIGKTTVAINFALYLLCSKKNTRMFGCEKCDSCTQILKHIHPDVYYISPEDETITIDIIRDNIRALSQSPIVGKYNVAIVKDAHYLTVPAANSFLKFLEEAPKNTIIILISPHFYSLLETVRSRCQMLRFSPPSKTELIAYLKNTFGIREQVAMKILYVSNGRPGIAIECLKNPDVLGQYTQIMNALVTSFSHHTIEEKFTLAARMLDLDTNILHILLRFIQTLIHIKVGMATKESSEYSAITLLAEKYTFTHLLNMAYETLKIERYMRAHVNKRLALENLFINI